MVALQSNERGLTVVQSSRISFKYPINLGISKDTWIISDNLQELQEPQEQQKIL
jgi:hypothetical protein